MDATEFIKTVGDFFDSWHRRLAQDLRLGRRRIRGPWAFPLVLRAAETPDHFLAELCGATTSKDPTKLRLDRPSVAERFTSASKFINGGLEAVAVDDAKFVQSADANMIANVAFTSDFDEETFRKKVGFAIKEARIIASTTGIPVSITPTADRQLWCNVDVVWMDDVRVVFRTISTALCVRKERDQPTLREWLRQQFQTAIDSGIPAGLACYSASAQSFARELTSLADQDVSEPVIDRFIRKHGDHFQRALRCTRHLAQKRLRWIERNDLDPDESVPDYLLERPDGYWDILDLKRAALRKKSIVRGLPSRPRFIDYVNGLIAQLDRYRSYFEKPKNAQWALEEFGVKVKSPRLIGVVGNYDSFRDAEVTLAMSQYRKDLLIMSYAAVIDLLRNSETQLYLPPG